LMPLLRRLPRRVRRLRIRTRASDMPNPAMPDSRPETHRGFALLPVRDVVRHARTRDNPSEDPCAPCWCLS
jgi:hypothetical protein